MNKTKSDSCEKLRHNSSQMLPDLLYIVIFKVHVTLELNSALGDLTQCHLGSIIFNRGRYALGEGRAQKNVVTAAAKHRRRIQP